MDGHATLAVAARALIAEAIDPWAPALLEIGFHGARRSAAHVGDAHVVAGAAHGPRQVRGVVDVLIVDAGDDVAVVEPGLLGRRARNHLADPRAMAHTVVVAVAGVEVLDPHAESAAAHHHRHALHIGHVEGELAVVVTIGLRRLAVAAVAVALLIGRRRRR